MFLATEKVLKRLQTGIERQPGPTHSAATYAKAMWAVWNEGIWGIWGEARGGGSTGAKDNEGEGKDKQDKTVIEIVDVMSLNRKIGQLMAMKVVFRRH